MLLKISDWLVFQFMGLEPASKLGAATHFFIYDAAKIFLLLAGMIFVVGVGRTWIREEALERRMSRGGLWANALAAVFGAVTPFCSCSSIPIFISLMKAGVPLGAAFSFLVTSPLINEYLVVLMAGEFGVPITLAYVVSGLGIGIGVGAVIGRMGLEHHLERDISAPTVTGNSGPDMPWRERLRRGGAETASVLRQIWAWVLLGVAAGAAIHNYVPQETVHSVMREAGWLSVPAATLLGVPMYGSCAAIVPVAVALFQKGIPLGTALAFMMAMAALSAPEAIMLRRAMRLPLIAIFFAVTSVAIMAIGYLFNWLQPILVR